MAGDLDRDLGHVALRVLQEALTNARRHGGVGAHVNVDLTWADTMLTMSVKDDGLGNVIRQWRYFRVVGV